MAVKVVSILCFLLFVLFRTHQVRADVFTALTDLEPLLETEHVLLDSLAAYLRYQEQRINVLKNKYNELEHDHRAALKDVAGYFTNPVNSFKIIKRLTTDWGQVEEAILNDAGKDVVLNISSIKSRVNFPTGEDLSGAAIALVRLQDTYKLDPIEVAKGLLNGKKYSGDMSAHDCFELGRQTYNNGDYDHTAKWMNVALHKYSKEHNKTVEKSEILEYLAFSSYMTGNVETALELTHELLNLIPNHIRAIGNIPHYEKAIIEKRNAGEKPKEKPEEIDSWALEKIKYEELCRDEFDLSESIKKDLKCRYFFGTSKFLTIGPMKIEEHYLDPYIIVFHDILTESEMDLIKEKAKPKFRRATVQDSVTGELVTAKYRISKSAWLKDEEHEMVKKISDRITDMTGLSMTTAEELQVVNYGIGGHYEPHYDFARKSEVKAFGGQEGNGNRIATVLFYMSDVEQGGSTVFPELGLSLKPKKGAGAFWFNLFPSGEGNLGTRHAACPVLQGSKWVSNKWIHVVGQEFIRPCTLEYQVEGAEQAFAKPVKKHVETR